MTKFVLKDNFGQILHQIWWILLAPVKGNQVCILLFHHPQKWCWPSTVWLWMTKWFDLKWCVCASWGFLGGLVVEMQTHIKALWLDFLHPSHQILDLCSLARINGHSKLWSDYYDPQQIRWLVTVWSSLEPGFFSNTVTDKRKGWQRAFGVGMVTPHSYAPLSQSPASSSMTLWTYTKRGQHIDGYMYYHWTENSKCITHRCDYIYSGIYRCMIKY